MTAPEQGPVPLAGGYQSTVVRVGSTVRRTRSDNSAFAHAVLRHLESCAWPASPRLLDADESEEVLTYIEGAVPPPTGALPAWAAGDSGFHGTLRLLRELHDLTAGSDLARGGDVVCHNDPAPRNVVFRGGSPVALIDWDHAAPGCRVTDVAFACWQFHSYDVPGRSLLATMQRRLARLADTYGAEATPAEVVPEMLRIQRANLSALQEHSAAGVPEYVAKAEGGAIRWETAWLAWSEANERALAEA